MRREWLNLSRSRQPPTLVFALANDDLHASQVAALNASVEAVRAVGPGKHSEPADCNNSGNHNENSSRKLGENAQGTVARTAEDERLGGAGMKRPLDCL